MSVPWKKDRFTIWDKVIGNPPPLKEHLFRGMPGRTYLSPGNLPPGFTLPTIAMESLFAVPSVTVPADNTNRVASFEAEFTMDVWGISSLANPIQAGVTAGSFIVRTVRRHDQYRLHDVARYFNFGAGFWSQNIHDNLYFTEPIRLEPGHILDTTYRCSPTAGAGNFQIWVLLYYKIPFGVEK